MLDAPALADAEVFLAHLRDKYAGRRLFLTGYSAGAILVQHLATTDVGRVAVCAAASAAGTLFHNATANLTQDSYPLLFWHGVDDDLVPFPTDAIARYAQLSLPHTVYRLPRGHNVFGFRFPNGTGFASAAFAFLVAHCA